MPIIEYNKILIIMNIYEILATKPHNSHYLKRYINFIDLCLLKNKTLSKNEYTETHHICPKADDLFPEYKDLRINRWNSIKLTARQHIIAHIILWKTYGKSQYLAANYMVNVQNSSTKFNNRSLPKSIEIRYAAKLREQFSSWRKGKSAFKDFASNKYFLETDDPLIKELNLVGNNAGLVMSEEIRQKFRDAKYPSKKVTLYFLNNETTVRLFSTEFDEYLSQGWSTVKTKDDYEHCENLGKERRVKSMADRVRYATPDGVFYGLLYRDDPKIKELNLISYVTDKNRAQWVERTNLATEAKLGANLYTDGINEQFSKEHPGEGWVLGRAPRSEEWESKRSAASVAKCKGAETWTDGKNNYFIQPGDKPPLGAWKGMKLRPNHDYYYLNENKTAIKILKGSEEVPIGYERFELKKLNKICKEYGISPL